MKSLTKWFFGMCSAFGIKMSSSIDDVVWLAPFLASNSGTTILLQNALIYTTVCMLQTVVAMLISYSGKSALDALTGGRVAWSTERILTVAAGALLALYSLKLIHEEIYGSDDDDDHNPHVQDQGTEELDYSIPVEHTSLLDMEVMDHSVTVGRESSREIQYNLQLQEVKQVADMEELGKGEAKTAEQLTSELRKGRSKLVTTSDGQVQRQVDVVALRMFSDCTPSKSMLLRVREAFPDGRKREKIQLPGTKQGPGQSVEECVQKIISRIGLSDVKTSFSYSDLKVEQTELESWSYPGMVTLYNKSMVRGYVIIEDSSSVALDRIGLPSGQAFERLDETSRVTYFYEWMPEDRANKMLAKAEQQEQERASARALKAKRDRQKTLFVITFLGSVDDLTLFVPMLAGKGFDTSELLLGALLATITIMAICFFIGLCKPIADCLSRIPLAAIVVVFASVLLIKGLFLEEDEKKL